MRCPRTDGGDSAEEQRERSRYYHSVREEHAPTLLELTVNTHWVCAAVLTTQKPPQETVNQNRETEAT